MDTLVEVCMPRWEVAISYVVTLYVVSFIKYEMFVNLSSCAVSFLLSYESSIVSIGTSFDLR